MWPVPEPKRVLRQPIHLLHNVVHERERLVSQRFTIRIVACHQVSASDREAVRKQSCDGVKVAGSLEPPSEAQGFSVVYTRKQPAALK